MKKAIIISLAIIIIGSFLRFLNPTSLPVFADESIYVRWSQVMRAEASLRFLPLSDGKQPLYMWTVIPFLKFISDPLIAGRMVSGLCGLATAAGVGIASYLLFSNRRLAYFASLIWVILPYAVFFDRLAIADSMLTMFVIWTFVFSYLTITLVRLDTAMLAGICLGFAWLTKSPAVFSYALIPATFLVMPWWRTSRKKVLLSIGLIFVIFIISFGMYNILRLGPEFHMINIRNQDYILPLSEVLRHPADPLIPHLKDVFFFFLYLATPVGLGLAVLGLADGQKKHIRQRLILALWWIVPVVTQSFIAKSFTARYLLFTVPFSAILMAHALWHIGDKTKKHFLALVGLGLMVFVCLGFDYLLIKEPQNTPLPANERAGYLEDWTAGTGIREVADYLKKLPPNQPVLVGSEGFFGTPFSALQMYLNANSNIRIIGVGLDISAVDQKLTNSLSDNQVYLVVNASRFKGSPDALGLKLIGSYPKAERPDGSKDYLLFFQLQAPKQ